jgi:hypothetical protein
MAEINVRTLMMAVQAVDAKIRELSRRIDGAKAVEATDFEDLLLCYTRAADDLREAYRAACKPNGNMPPYEKLVATNDPY